MLDKLARIGTKSNCFFSQSVPISIGFEALQLLCATIPVSDIFISYAWADNKPPVGAREPRTDRWVWQFEIALSAALSNKRKVWIDRQEARANIKVEALLTEGLQRSRLLLLLMSQNWLESSWCRAELNAFLEAHPGTATKEGVFVVEIEPVPRDDWHDRIRSLGAFPFHKPLDKGRGTVRLGHPLPDVLLDRDFYQDVVALAQQINDELAPVSKDRPDIPQPDALKPDPISPRGSEVTLPSAPQPPLAPLLPDEPPPRERVVWIAEPTDDLMRKRRDLRDAIVQAGYKVVLPDVSAMLRKDADTVHEQLERSLVAGGLFVNLLGPHAGRSDDSGRSWAQVQADLARALAEREGWPHIVWRDRGTDVVTAEEPHRSLLTGSIEQGFEELRRDVLGRLPVQRVSASGVAMPVRPMPLSICVTSSEEDEKIGDEVSRMLDQLDAEYFQFVDGRGGRTSAADKAEDRVLANSAGVVIVYGAADANWLITKVQHVNQLRGRLNRIWGALVDAPAPTPGKSPAPKTRAIERHDWSTGPRFDLMQRFVATIREAPGV